MEELSFIQPPARLARIVEQTAAIGFAMASESRTGALLRALAASKPGGRLLELGTGTGIATCWLLDGMDAASAIISVDVDASPQRVAREALSGDTRLTLVTEDAMTFLRGQEDSGFDLVFADALPGKYEGLDEALRVVKSGGFYVIDDMLPQPNWPEGHAAKVPGLIAQLAARQDFRMVPLAWASGIVIAVKTYTGT
jgi:predicted O-methyltransferase YrrM